MENIEFRLLTLELTRGINTDGWKILNEEDSNLIIITHPEFNNSEQFALNLFQANKSTTERIKNSKIAEAFGIDWKEKDNRGVVFLVENNDVWQTIGTEPLKNAMTLWWVRELGDGISLYYTKGRENLDTPTILAANRYHEFVHKLQKIKLSIDTFNTFFREFSLLEGMANWWEGWIIRPKYKEKDFLEYYLSKDRFMSTFLTSAEITSREGHNSLSFPWNTILTGIIFQRIGALIEEKNMGSTQSSGEIKDFNYEQVQKGLKFVSSHLNIANEFDGKENSLTETFLEELCKRELGATLGYKELLRQYDRRGYDLAYNIITRQDLTETEKISLKRQTEEYRQKNN